MTIPLGGTDEGPAGEALPPSGASGTPNAGGNANGQGGASASNAGGSPSEIEDSAPPDLSAPCTSLGPEGNQIQACVLDDSGVCPPGFGLLPEAELEVPVCVHGEADCSVLPSVLTWAHERAATLGLLQASRQRMADVNAWPFCAEQPPYVPGDQISGTTAVDGTVFMFHARLSSATGIRVVHTEAPLRLQIFDNRCAPLLTSQELGPMSLLEPSLDSGRYVIVVLAAAANTRFTLELSGGKAGRNQPMKPIWELRGLGYDTCEAAGRHRVSQCDGGWGASNILLGPESDPPSYSCTESVYYKLPPCPEPEALFLILSQVRVVLSHFPPGLSQVTLRQLAQSASCPTCTRSIELPRPSTAQGVPFVDVRDGDSIFGSLSTSGLGGYRATGVALGSLPPSLLTTPSWGQLPKPSVAGTW